ncbi:MAG: polyprenyl synthetase family protein [Chloroflexota bacterium]|nr:polyprenyl synthetase family protein [Chloroflexota bacterium]
MPFHETLARYTADVNGALARVFEELTPQAARVHPSALEVAEAVRDFTLGPGKRLRPVLMRVAYEGFGGTHIEAIIRASCAVELMQSFLLIHDDIMDRSELRRGQPTVHREYAARYRGQVRDADHFGQAMGVLAGSLAGQQATLILSQSLFPPDRIAQALTRYAEVALDVCYGQALDMALPERPMEEITETDVLHVAEYKTARYTTEGPLHLGAILAGAEDEILEKVSAYAIPLGIAFQMRDDLLGMFGGEDAIGKSADSDLLEGKRTLLVLRAWERADADQRTVLKRALGNPKATAAELGAARKVIESTGAHSATVQEMRKLVDQAKGALADVPFTPEMTQFLSQLADYVANRGR